MSFVVGFDYFPLDTNVRNDKPQSSKRFGVLRMC